VLNKRSVVLMGSGPDNPRCAARGQRIFPPLSAVPRPLRRNDTKRALNRHYASGRCSHDAIADRFNASHDSMQEFSPAQHP
jgi:hypothetical protein